MANSAPFTLAGNVVDIFNKKIFPAEIVVESGKIKSVTPKDDSDAGGHSGYMLPGFIDSHVHIESSMLIPSEFARLAVIHGTVATISDPHEIANVCGMEGVDFMIEDGKTVPFKFNFGAPSCVPATVFETAGATLDSEDVKKLLSRPEIKYLSEMMNFPGVLNHDEEVFKKLAAAQLLDKPVDGHAPGLRGEEARQYIEAGISTDHECFTAEEALDKLKHGMWILIREGSAAKNFEALFPLLNVHHSRMMFCSDDKHPDSLLEGHINQVCARAVAKGVELFKVLEVACLNPVKHYKLDVGLLREGDPADFIVAEDLVNFNILQTYIGGELVADKGKSLINSNDTTIAFTINNFSCKPVDAPKLKILTGEYPEKEGKIPVMEALDGQLITNKLWLEPTKIGDEYVSDPDRDILKLVVINRYTDAPPAKCFIKNFGITRGALASSVAHDSHNIVAVGTDDELIIRAVNLVIDQKGGISAVGNGAEKVLPLPVAGLMSAVDGFRVAGDYTAIDKFAKSFGGNLSAPFMTLSFMALLVIPHLKLSDKGLFDGDRFEFLTKAG